MRHYAFFLLLIFTAFSCNTGSKSSLQVIDTQVDKPSPQNLSQVFKPMGTIKLEHADMNLISDVKQLVKTSDRIFVSGSNKVLQYDMNGHFLRQIGNIGTDTGQYQTLVVIAADEKTSTLVLASTKHLMVYDKEGILLQTIPVTRNILPEFASFYDGHLWVYYKWMGLPAENNEFIDLGKYYRYNDQMEVVDSSIIRRNTNKWQVFSRGHVGFNLSVNDSGTYMYNPILVPETCLRDTLYEIDGSAIFPSLRLDFSKILSVKKDVVLNPRTQNQHAFFKSMNLIRSVTISNIFRTNCFVFAEYSHLGKPFIFCYDLIGQKGYHMPEGFTDDIYGSDRTVQLFPLDLGKGEFCFVRGGTLTGKNFDSMSSDNDIVLFLVNTRK